MIKDFLPAKWQKFEKRAKLFRHIPFVDFVLASGSMAMGTARQDSDFDVIVGVRHGRIFTARLLAILLFELFGWRAKKSHSNTDKRLVADRICLNHFVTAKSYKLSPPHNTYWRKLYSSLVPLFGTEEKVNHFFAENSIWMGGSVLVDFSRLKKNKSGVNNFLQKVLNGKIGDWFEAFAKAIQMAKINKNEKGSQYKPRLIISDSELEFHPHTSRIDKFCEENPEEGRQIRRHSKIS